MRNKKVISTKNLPSRAPITFIAVLYLYMDKYHAPQWLWGAVAVLILIIIVACIVAKVNEEENDVFKM